MTCFEGLEQVPLSGIFDDKSHGDASSAILLALQQCNQKDLAEGQECFKKEYVDRYFEDKQIYIIVSVNSIDYDDLENPIKSHLKYVA